MRHTFTVDIQWNEGLQGKAQPRGVADELNFSVPAAFGGPGGEWTPEHFFAASINSCILATFLTIAANSKLAFSSYRASAKATMEQTPEGLRMTEIELVPEVAVKTEDDKERALRLLEKSEAMCPISNSVTSKITFSPSVVVTG
jgi:organic hydroperoxide reductase OsmC/OhrA